MAISMYSEENHSKPSGSSIKIASKEGQATILFTG